MRRYTKREPTSHRCSWQICQNCKEEFWGTSRKKLCNNCMQKSNQNKYKNYIIELKK